MSPESSPIVQEMFAQAVRDHQAGRLSEAERLFRDILQRDARNADALHGLGVIAQQAGQPHIAVDLIRQAIGLNANVAIYQSSLGNALNGLGRPTDALRAYRAAHCIKPEFADALVNLGVALSAIGRLDDAIAAFGKALFLRPDLAEAHYNLGVALQSVRRLDDAIAAFGAALRIKPCYADALYHLGLALFDLGDPGRAVAAYRAALLVTPHNAKLLCNLGVALADLGRIDDAVAAYGRALRLQPDLAEAHCNLGFALLLTGRYAQGWPEHEWRWRTAARSSRRRDFAQAQWQGEDLAGKTILLHAEQGLGDAIQFCRYVPMVAARGGRVILEVQRPLMKLMGDLDGAPLIIARGDPSLPPFDLHCPLMSLPQAFGTSLETIPATVPYLKADPERVAAWARRLPSAGFRVGIGWQGNPGFKDDHKRSAPLANFASLARLPGVRLISLQKHDGLDQLRDLPDGMRVETLPADFDDGPNAFLDTAAVMMTLDLIITTDTAIAHLAGALGRPVWLPLMVVPHWVFMLHRDDTPWYPTARLFRQTSRGDWRGVFDRMALELGRLR